MARTLSNDLRKRLVKAVEGGLSARAAGKKLDIAASTATGIVKDWRDRGVSSHFGLAATDARFWRTRPPLSKRW